MSVARRVILALLLAWPSVVAALEPPWPPESSDCTAAIATAERSREIPPGLLAAIGRVESGRPDRTSGTLRPWPWAVNIGGAGRFLPTKAEAMAVTAAVRAQGVASIDVGCMQVNLMHHPAAFASLEEAFDPLSNALFAAQFLKGLFTEIGDWPAAVAAYHSHTPEIGALYQEKVLAAWVHPESTPPSVPAPRRREFAVPDWVEVANSTAPAWQPPAPKALPPTALAPAAPSRWVERVIVGVAACSQPIEEPAAGDPPARPPMVWKAARGCSTSPFARPETLRQLFAQQ
jgi:Transglycosylase SLT domain